MTTKTRTAWLVILALVVNTGVAFAQGPVVKPEKQRFNDMLGIAGLLTVVMGGVLMVPSDDPSSKSYYFEGAGSYCADNGAHGNVAVTRGGCSEVPAMRTAGIILMGAGAAMAFVGFRKVEVSPQIGHKTLGAIIKMNW